MAVAVNIVDGHVGKAHVTSDDLAAFNEAAYGTRMAVLPYGGNFNLTLSTTKANTVFLASGAGIVAGRRFIAGNNMEIAIGAGTQGTNRIDVVVARYAKGSDEKESVSIEVVRGTAAASAVQPDVGEDDLPLWRVFVRGEAAASIARIAPVLPPAAFEEYDGGGWHVRKRSDGYVEMDKRISAPFKDSTDWVARQSYPLPLAACYSAHVTASDYRVEKLYCSPMENGGASCYVGGSASQAHTSGVSVSVRGRWK